MKRIPRGKHIGGLVLTLKLGDEVSINNGEITLQYVRRVGQAAGIAFKCDREKYVIDHEPAHLDQSEVEYKETPWDRVKPGR